ncbi:hypothetical protein [uncultured Ruminococcus sp.]|uniref:hypothetical protein n=1 Tax=uncultured Ruminococcus sp. TaxID=165186 RepID=UPI0026222865|nr:hypothetical protein [uncultured Ruminococcus sp.]
MFWEKKNEEEIDHIIDHTANYNGGAASEEYSSIPQTKEEYIAKLFRPYLYKEEQILCVAGNGDVEGGYGTPASEKKMLKALLIVVPICIAAFALGVLAGELPRDMVIITVLFVLFGMPAIIVLSIIVWLALGGLSGSANYAVTNQRVLAMVQENWQEISLKEVKKTAMQGRIVTVTSEHGLFLGIYYASDPLRLKAILDEAVQKCKYDIYQDQ